MPIWTIGMHIPPNVCPRPMGVPEIFSLRGSRTPSIIKTLDFDSSPLDKFAFKKKGMILMLLILIFGKAWARVTGGELW